MSVLHSPTLGTVPFILLLPHGHQILLDYIHGMWPGKCAVLVYVSFSSGKQKLAQKPQPTPSRCQLTSISWARIVSLGSPQLQDRLRKQLAFPTLIVEGRIRKGFESVHWIQQPERFPEQLMLSKHGKVDLTALT